VFLRWTLGHVRGHIARMAKNKAPKQEAAPSAEAVDVVRDIEQWPIKKVKPYKRNAKSHPPEQVERLSRLIKKHGFDQPIVVDSKGVIVKGHGRWLAAQFLDMTEVPVIVRADLTPAQCAEARLADNRVAEGWGWDYDLLRDDLMIASDLPDFDAELTGFNLEDITKSAEQALGGEPDEGDEPQEKQTLQNDELRYSVIVDFDTEEEQGAFLEEQEAKGHKCRLLIS
jgi:ParB-like chromosome segregation protein Spo0J